MNMKRVAIASGAALRAIAASLLGLLSGTLVSCANTAQFSSNTIEGNRGDRDAKLRSLGVSLGDLGNPFFVAMSKGAQTQAKKIGGDDVKVSVVSSGFDLNQQFNQLENFVAADSDLIILSE